MIELSFYQRLASNGVTLSSYAPQEMSVSPFVFAAQPPGRRAFRLTVCFTLSFFVTIVSRTCSASRLTKRKQLTTPSLLALRCNADSQGHPGEHPINMIFHPIVHLGYALRRDKDDVTGLQVNHLLIFPT
jgi:hypothetical protein